MDVSTSPPNSTPWPFALFQPMTEKSQALVDAFRDPRWRRVKARLKALRLKGRRAVRIVDVNCGNGGLLVQSADYARSLGFLSIEAVGVDCSSRLIEAARHRARSAADLAIGLKFDVAEPLWQLEAEAEFPADIVLFEEPARPSPALAEAVRRAGDLVLRIAPYRTEARR